MFKERLVEAMQRKGVTQAALAEHLGVSAASVSSWCSGTKTPNDVGRLASIADFLSVSPGYLQFGGEESHHLTDHHLAEMRNRYRDELTWYWRLAPRDRGREYGNAAAYAFETDITTLARESAQNISDERLETAASVLARYTVSELSGEHLQSFLTAIRFDAVRPHLEAATATNKKAGNVIERGLAEIDQDRLVLIRVDDFDANGLTGPEYDRGRFMAVVRNTLDSQKGETAGGSFGLGWATLPASSQFGMVLCNSKLSVAQDGRTDNRFIGVIDLPWHEIEGNEFAGRGWYGVQDHSLDGPEPKPTISCWENEALARDCRLSRSSSQPGTSFLIVGAYDASGELDTVEGIAERLSKSLADNFWPAMITPPDGSARLQATVRAERNGTTVMENYVVPSRYQPGKVAAFEKHLRDDVVETLDTPGDVVRRSVSLEVPRRTVEPKHPALEHEATLLVVQAGDENGEGDDEPGTLTYLRGSHMVISCARVGALPIGARTFHAVLLAGEAAGDTGDDRSADRFLRASEPPAHNKWTGTSELTASYQRGGPTSIRAFDAAVKAAVRDIIRQPSRDLSDGPEALKELLRIAPPKQTGKKPRVKSVRAHALDADGAWVITEATVTLPKRDDGRGWTISPILKFGTQSGSPIPVKWASVEAIERCSLDAQGRLVSPPSARSAVFSAVTDPSSHPVGGGRSKILVDVRIHTEEVTP